MAVRLSVDPRQADQNVRGTVIMPNGTGKVARVLVLAKGEKEKEARDAGADFVGGDDMIKRIQEENWLDFDRVIATPDIMGAVGRIGKILGPRGLMPNPRVGTVTFDVAKAVQEVKAGKVDYRVDKAGVVHARIGKMSFGEEKLAENAHALLGAIVRSKPASAKGNYVKSVAVVFDHGSRGEGRYRERDADCRGCGLWETERAEDGVDRDEERTEKRDRRAAGRQPRPRQYRADFGIQG